MAQPSRPNPLHGATYTAPTPPPAAAPSKPPPAQVNIHGIPPKPNMAPLPEPNEEIVNDATQAEMSAGKKALDVYRQRTEAEHAYGKKAIARLNRVTQEGNKGKNDEDAKNEDAKNEDDKDE
jgi:hypothetical protein